MAKSDWQQVSRTQRCPICDGADNCSVSSDGGAVWCGRVEQGSQRQNAGGQFLHLLGDGQHRRDDRSYEHPSHRRQRRTAEKPKARADFEHIARTAFCRADASQRRHELAAALGVTATALEQLRVGPWGLKDGLHWLFPERDASGNIIGLNRRYRNGDKRTWPNSDRGLIYCDNWQAFDGPVYLVEGPSDTAAMLSLGLCVVGRPSNTGGVDHLVQLLTQLPSDRGLIVLGENDRKSHDSLKPNAKARHRVDCEGCSLCWPGLFGAQQTATRLAEELRKPVAIALPPNGSKDVRDMVRRSEGAA